MNVRSNSPTNSKGPSRSNGHTLLARKALNGSVERGSHVVEGECSLCGS